MAALRAAGPAGERVRGQNSPPHKFVPLPGSSADAVAELSGQILAGGIFCFISLGISLRLSFGFIVRQESFVFDSPDVRGFTNGFELVESLHVAPMAVAGFHDGRGRGT
jgi:hypothetical protein